MDCFDLFVVGGGPGGCACVLAAARRGLRVALFEPGRPGRDRPCGEGILPMGVVALRRLGFSALLEKGRPFPGARFLLEGAPPLEADFPRPGIAIPRPDLQGALDRAVSDTKGIERFRETVRPQPADGGFEVASECGPPLRARHLVVADGSEGSAAPWLERPGLKAGGRLGLRARFQEAEPLDRVQAHLFPGFEIYLTPLPGGRINAAVLLEKAPPAHASPAEVHRQAIARCPQAARHLGALLDPAHGKRVGGRPPSRTAGGGAFLVGDAGGGIDPIIGCGLSLALRSGILASSAVAALRAGAPEEQVFRRYARAYQRETSSRRGLVRLLRVGSRHPSVGAVTIKMIRRHPGLLHRMVRTTTGFEFPDPAARARA